MPSYKLTYFNLSGRGEPIRYLLSYGGVDFEDNRIAPASWPELKPKTPLGQLPILEVDGKTLYQSNAIARYLAHKFGLLGSNDFEAFEVDAAIETIEDLKKALTTWFFNSDAAKKSATEAETLKKIAFYLEKFEATVKNNGGYFVGGKLTAADIVFAGSYDTLLYMTGKDLIVDYPSLKALINKVVNIPAIKSYIAKNPKA